MTYSKNIFNFAPKELSGSAFWAWVLHEACVGKSNNDAAAIGEKLLSEIDLETKEVKNVATELSIRNETKDGSLPKQGRVDIALLGEGGSNLAFIENKHFSTPQVDRVIDQVSNYAQMVKGSPKKVIMTFRHDTRRQWGNRENSDIHFFGLEEQVELIRDSTSKKCPIVEAYYQYTNQLLNNRKSRLEELSKSFSDMSSVVWDSDDSLYEMMLKLTKGIDELDTYIGTSFGRPWVQAAFSVCGRTFFYRLDKDKKGPYLRINDYSPDKEDKTKLANSISSLLNDGFSPFEWNGSNLKGKETTLLKLYLNNDAPCKDIGQLRQSLVKFHPRFLLAVKEAHKNLQG